MSNLIDPEAVPSESMPVALEGYLRGWTDLQPDDNETAFRRMALLPRVMTGHSGVDVTCTLMGMTMGAPLMVGAFAADRLFHPDGLLPVARICHRLRLPLVVSEETVTPLAEITAHHDLCWLQIRGAGSLDRAGRLVALAAAEGARGLVVTLLAPTHPCPGQQPGGLDVGAELARRHWSTIGSTGAGIGNVAPWPQWNWNDLQRVVAQARAHGLPVIAKGVLHPEDVAQALAVGCAATMVSNVGRRQIRRSVAPLDMLAEATAVTGDYPLLLDGGIRSGSDAIIACCLGATASVVVRPVAKALAMGGEAEVERLLSGYVNEITATASWLGVDRLAALGPAFLRMADGGATLPAPTGSTR